MSADGQTGRARIAVGVSGTGSNLRALHAAAGRGELGGDVVLVFADRPCPALDWAAEQGIDTALVPDGRDDALDEALAAAHPDVVVLAGYMRVVGPRVIEAFAGRIANVHPSLLPSFPGLRPQQQALDHGVKVSGVTVHLVTADLDAGPIVVQRSVPVLDGDTEETLAARILVEEHHAYPDAIAIVLDGGWRIEGRRVVRSTTAAVV